MTTRVLSFTMLFVLLAGPANGQGLTITSVTPTEDAVNVPLEARIEFTFSKPLPLTGTEFTERFIWSPVDSLQVVRYGHAMDQTGKITLVFYEVNHRPNTDYTFIAHDIRAADGSMLASPYVLNYTTASALGTGIVNGSVSFGTRGDTEPSSTTLALESLIRRSLLQHHAETSRVSPGSTSDGRPLVGLSATGARIKSIPDLEQSVVLLLNEYDLGSTWWQIQKGGSVDASGNYSIDHVRDGVYWPLAVNFSETLDGTISSYGFYDPDGDLEPDSIVVNGNNTQGISLTLYPFSPATAKANLLFAQEALSRVAADGFLATVSVGPGPSGDFLLPGGQAYQWSYTFCSPSEGIVADVVVDPINAFTFWDHYDVDTVSVCQQQPIPEPFIDSDQALDIADQSGGSVFRAKFPGQEVAVIVAAGDLALPIRPAPDEVFWTVQYISPPTAVFEELTIFVDIESGGVLEGTAVSNEPSDVGWSTSPELAQNYPNPFKASTHIEYTISKPAYVRLTVHDLAGRQVAVLADGYKMPGSFTADWSGADLASGTYLYRLDVDGRSITKMLTLVR